MGFRFDPNKRRNYLCPSKPTCSPNISGSGDPAFKDYYPAWLDNMADDATVEGSMLDGAVQGAKAVRCVCKGN